MKMPDLPIIEKTLKNEAAPREARKVARWLATAEGQQWLSERMDSDEKAIRAGEEEKQIDHAIPSALLYRKIMHRLHARRVRRYRAYAAAILLPVALFIGLFMHLDSRVDLAGTVEYEEVYVPRGERMQLLFQDGSKVYLNAGSRLRYPKKFGLFERKVFLEGEAWFEVTKNKRRPFIVDVAHLHIKVVGTTFDVKAYPEEDFLWVALETGCIELKSDSLPSCRLQPGEKATYDKRSGRCEIVQSHHVELYSAWKRNVLVFKNAPLSQVLNTLARTYNISFEIKDSTALKYTYTITTNCTNLTNVLKELEKITPILFEEKEGIMEVGMK